MAVLSPPPTGEPPPSGEPPASGGSDNTAMLVLSYLWILALIPLLTEKEDQEVQWHAKNGLVLLAAEFCLWVVLIIVPFIPVIGQVVACGGCGLFPFIMLGFLVIRIIAIVKATQGQRFVIPYLSDFVEKF